MEPWLFILKNKYIIEIAKFLLLITFAIMGFYLSRIIFLPLIRRFLKRTQIKWDDLLTDNKVFSRLMLLIPAMILSYGLPFLPEFQRFLSKPIHIYVYFVIIAILNSFIDAFVAIYSTWPLSYKWPLKGWGQLLKMFITILGAIFIIALLLDRSPWGLISSIGAMTAVLMLIFKDTLLSFVAGLQIAGYNLIRVGEWIEMPEFGVNGDVVDISLHTIKVQNFDKTTISVPTYKFLDNSFKNWRGMYETHARRIKQSLSIDQSSVIFLDQRMQEKLEKVDLLKNYLDMKTKDASQNSTEHDTSWDKRLNNRGPTNLGAFRAYVTQFLRKNPYVRKDMTLIVRYLQPEAAKGLSLQIYCFINDTRWAQYESIQADILDHILAALPFFGLRIYQRNALADQRCESAAGKKIS